MRSRASARGSSNKMSGNPAARSHLLTGPVRHVEDLGQLLLCHVLLSPGCRDQRPGLCLVHIHHLPSVYHTRLFSATNAPWRDGTDPAWLCLAGRVSSWSGGAASLPPGGAVVVAGSVEGAVPGAAPEEPLHLVLIQLRLADVGVQLVVLVVPNALLTVDSHGLLPHSRTAYRPSTSSFSRTTKSSMASRASGGVAQHTPQPAVMARGTGSAGPAGPPPGRPPPWPWRRRW